MPLVNNIYNDFISDNKESLEEMCRHHKAEKGEGILLVDLDAYLSNKCLEENVYFCKIEDLPEYARVKLAGIERMDEKLVYAVKHVGLCLVTETNIRNEFS